MTKLPPILPLKLSFKHRDDCPVSMLHLETFGDGSERKSRLQRFQTKRLDDHLKRYPFLTDEEQDAVVREFQKQMATEEDDT